MIITMKNVLILYASQTGMTMDVAGNLADRLRTQLPEHQFETMSVRDVGLDQLASYPKIILGASTWDHGNPAPDGEEFLANITIQKPDLSGISFALFGLGETAYPEFCGALPLIQEDLETRGATIYSEQFTIDGYPPEATMVELTNWAVTFLNN